MVDKDSSSMNSAATAAALLYPPLREPEVWSAHGPIRLPPIEWPLRQPPPQQERVSTGSTGGAKATLARLPSVGSSRGSPNTVLSQEGSALSLSQSGDIDACAARDQHLQKVNASVQAAGHKILASDVYRASVRKPAPSNSGLIRCTVHRIKPLLGATTYQLCLDEGDVPLLAAKKTKAAYLICADMDSLNQDAEHTCLARLVHNVMGSEYVLQGDVGKGAGMEDEVLMHWAPTSSIAGAPRSMQVVMPNAQSPSSGRRDLTGIMEDALHENSDSSKVDLSALMLCTKAPTFDPVRRVYTLDFMGRQVVSAPSNMQLTRWLPGGFIEAGSGSVMFQFVQIGRDSFALDFCGPLSPLAAFAIALSSLDDKLIYSLG